MWLYMRGIFRRRPHHVDRAREAQMSIDHAMLDIGEAEDKLRLELRDLAGRVKAAKKESVAVRRLLMSSREKRQALEALGKKKWALERHRETLAATELNGKVLKSMKETSGILKDCGMEDQLKEVDETMLDMRESLDNVNMLSSSLAEGAGDFDTDDLLASELEILLSDEYDAPAAPAAAKRPKAPALEAVPEVEAEQGAEAETVPEKVPESDEISVVSPGGEETAVAKTRAPDMVQGML